MRAVYLLLFLALFGCTTQKGVYLNQLRDTPVLTLKGHSLTVQTIPSDRRSGFSVTDMHATVNHEKRIVYLYAYYDKLKETKETYEIDLQAYKIPAPKRYDFYWRDPNKVTLKLAVKVIE